MCFFIAIGFAVWNSLNTALAYNGSFAASYGLNWYSGYNTDYYYAVEGNDCTNFVSQCVEAGGMATVPISDYADLTGWRPHSGTWEQAELFRKYWKNTRGTNVYNTVIDYTNNTLNAYLYQKYWSVDVMQYHNIGESLHSQMVVGQTTYGGYPTLKVAQHTPNLLWPLSQYFQVTGYTHIRAFRFHAFK